MNSLRHIVKIGVINMIKKLLFVLISVTIVISAETNAGLKQACQDDNATACYLYALPMVTGENEKIQDIKEKGIAYMRQACVLDEYRACDVLGENYFSDQRYRAAIPYLDHSCDRGIKTACMAMGTIYRDGHDTRIDDAKSKEYYEKACMLKSADACYNVAIIYRAGLGAVKNRTSEKSYYKKACDIGLEAGCERYTELDNEDRNIETGMWASIKNWF